MSDLLVFKETIARGVELGGVVVIRDIIDTVAVQPALQNVAALAAIVLIRTFLSFSLEVEITGSLPWRRGERPARDSA